MGFDSGKLEERLIDFGTEVCLVLRHVPKDIPGVHISKQLVRSATSSAANYAEARGAQSRKDFAHKLHICLKELRETSVWLRLVTQLVPDKPQLKRLTQECNELISIFVASLNTTKASP